MDEQFDTYREFKCRIGSLNRGDEGVPRFFLVEDNMGQLVSIAVRFPKVYYKYVAEEDFSRLVEQFAKSARGLALIGSSYMAIQNGMIDVAVNIIQKNFTYARLLHLMVSLQKTLSENRKG